MITLKINFNFQAQIMLNLKNISLPEVSLLPKGLDDLPVPQLYQFVQAAHTEVERRFSLLQNN